MKVGDKVRWLEDGDIGEITAIGDRVHVKWPKVDQAIRYTLDEMEKHTAPVAPTPPPPPPASLSVLSEAQAVVEGPRRETYGHPRDNHSRTAAMWGAYLGKKLKPGETITMRDVCQLNSLQKISRDANKPHRDNLVDQAGWAANAEMVEEPA